MNLLSCLLQTEYHRNYCRSHEVPPVMVRCGSPSSKLAQTSEPCFKQKRKEHGHQTRRTYTTDYMQYEDVSDLKVSSDGLLHVNLTKGKARKNNIFILAWWVVSLNLYLCMLFSV